MTGKPMSHDDVQQLLTRYANALDGMHPIDVLTLAGFLATNALRCWAHTDDQLGIARGFCANLLNSLTDAPTETQRWH